MQILLYSKIKIKIQITNRKCDMEHESTFQFLSAVDMKNEESAPDVDSPSSNAIVTNGSEVQF